MAAEVGADALLQLGASEQPCWLNDSPFAMDPFRFNRIEPGRLDRQLAGEDAHTAPLLFHLPVVCSDPALDRLADVPGGVVPHKHQGRLPPCRKPGAAIGQERDRDRTYGPAIHEAQPELIGLRQEQPVTGQRLGIGIILRDRLFHQPHWLVRPGVERWLLHPRPPGLVPEAQDPVGMPGSQPDQPVASPFFRVYAGSGLVIQRFARFQPVPNRLIACRMVSSLTRYGVNPWRTLSPANRSSVQTLVGYPKSRGLRWASAWSCSRPAASKVVWMMWLRWLRSCRAAVPRSLKARVVLRTVWEAHPNCRAMAGGVSPRALASKIWLRRWVKASDERKPAFRASRSASVSRRTYRGGFMSHSYTPSTMEMH